MFTVMMDGKILVRFVFDVKVTDAGEEKEKYRVLEFENRADFQRQAEFVEPRGIAQFTTTRGIQGINLSQMLYYYEVN